MPMMRNEIYDTHSYIRILRVNIYKLTRKITYMLLISICNEFFNTQYRFLYHYYIIESDRLNKNTNGYWAIIRSPSKKRYVQYYYKIHNHIQMTHSYFDHPLNNN